MCFRFTKVALADTKQEYISTPKKVVIDLASSKLDPVLATGGQLVRPEPAMTVTQVLGFEATQRFDVTALVDKVSQTTRAGGPGRRAFDMFLVDDSKKGDKTIDVKVTLFYADGPSARLHTEMLEKAKSSKA